jgi:hypothetical protein
MRALLAVWALWHGLVSHIREASKVTVNSSYFHPAHRHYTGCSYSYRGTVCIYIYKLYNQQNDWRYTDNRTEESQIKSYTYTLHWHCKTIQTTGYNFNKATIQNYNTRSMRSKPSLHFPKLIWARHGSPIYCNPF